MGRRRLAVALLLPDPARTEVDGLRRAVGDPAREWVAPHLTLVPPVNVREERFREALDVVRSAAAAARPFDLDIGPTATFLPDNPVVYLAVGGELHALHALRDAVFTAPLERRLTWPFVPHVTIADGMGPERVEAAAAVLADYRRSVTVSTVTLLEEGDGRRWEPIADEALGGRAVVARGGLELELTESTWFDAGTRRWLAERWHDPRRPLAVSARRGGEVVGVAAGWTDAALANLSELFVVETARREGVGAHLVARFVAVAAERGARRVRLRTAAGGAAEAFFVRVGFRSEARYPGADDAADVAQLIRDL